MQQDAGNAQEMQQGQEEGVRYSLNEDGQQGQDNQIRYSLEEDEEGKIVHVEGRFLENVPRSEYGRAVKEKLREFRGKIVLTDGKTLQITNRSIGEYTNSKYTRRLRNEENTRDTVYPDKMRMSEEVDNVILSVDSFEREELNNKREDGIVAFERGKARIDVQGSLYSVDILIGIREDGEKIFYDAVNYKELNNEKAAPDVNSGTHQYDEQAPKRTGTASDTKIPQPAGDVKQKQEQTGKKFSNSAMLAFAKENGYLTIAQSRDERGNRRSGVILQGVDGQKMAQGQKDALRICDWYAKKHGITVILSDSDSNGMRGVKGKFNQKEKNTIYMNADMASDSFTRVMSHELFHMLKNEGLAEDAQRMVLDALEGDENYSLKERIREVQEKYRRQGHTISEEEALEEIAADGVLDFIGTDTNLETMYKENRTLFEKIRDFIEKTLSEIRGAFQSWAKGSKEARVLLDKQAQYQAIAQKMDEIMQARDAKTEQTDEKKVKSADIVYSIEEDRNGKPYVLIDDDRLENVPKGKWQEVIQNIIMEKFKGGIRLDNLEIRVTKKTAREMTRSKYAEFIRKYNPKLFSDKLRIANNLDELVETAEGFTQEDLHHERKDNITGFTRAYVRVRVGKTDPKDYIADIVFAEQKNGEILLYDVMNLTETKIDTEKAGVHTVSQINWRSRRSASPASGTNIQQSVENVNTENEKNRYSLDDEQQLKDELGAAYGFYQDMMEKLQEVDTAPFPGGLRLPVGSGCPCSNPAF